MEKTKRILTAKTAPNSKESEMMVLGCMLTNATSLNICSDGLGDDDFYYSEHKKIFLSLKEAYKRNSPADIHIIAENLKKNNLLKDIGGVQYLTTLAQYAATSAYVEEYTNLVKEKAVLRKMVDATQEIEKDVLNDPNDVYASLDNAQNLFFKISQRMNKDSGLLLKEILSGMKSKSQTPYLKELQERQEKFQKSGPENTGITGIQTHFNDLDKTINGLNKSNLMILAARPAMGKTAFAINISENVCFKNNLPVGIFSLEMSSDQLLHRIICSQSEVESEKIQTGSLDGDEYQRVVSVVNEMMHKTMIIDDQPGLSITDLRARARRMKEVFDIKFLAIDYLQLISGSNSSKSFESRQNEISEISRMLKNLARELDIPVLCLSQLSRKVEERQGHRPVMSDLRESGSIEQDSDIVMFLLRREYYDSHDKPGQAELIIAKNRHGAIGSVDLTFRSELAQFANYTPINASDEVFE
jgi:replicative DNA helicase